MKRLKVQILAFFTLSISFAQESTYPPVFWNLMDLNGNIELLGTHRTTDSYNAANGNTTESTFLSGKLDINTQSYFWHPNFLILDVGGTYFPGAGQNNSILLPDYAIETVSKQFRVKTSVFRNKKLNFKTYLNITDSYSNAENINESFNNNLDFGGAINFKNNIAPLRLDYRNYNNKQQLKPSNRTFINKGNYLTLTTSNSFGKSDANNFKFSQHNFNNTLKGVYTNALNTTTLNLNNRIYINENKSRVFSSNFSNIETTGVNSFKNLNLMENLIYSLPLNFRTISRFNYNNSSQNNKNTKIRTFSGVLEHKLYESLMSNIKLESRNIKQSAFNERSTILGYRMNYSKKLPLKGKLTLSYNYMQNKKDRDSKPIAISFFNEPFVLNNANLTIIQNPDVVEESIIVKDLTGALFYQENIDYILINLGGFYQIQRLPGGLIPDDTQVYIDFVALSTGDFKYTQLSKSFNSQISLFNDFFNMYYRYNNGDYKTTDVSNTGILNYITQNTYGFTIHYKWLKFGTEKDQRNSTIIPFKLNSYFANFNGRFNHKMSYGLNANIKDYEMIAEEGRSELYINVSGNLAYSFNYKTRLNVTAGYRKQEGESIDLDLVTARAELSTSINQLTLKLSADLYRRNYLLTEDYNYNSINLRITRKF